MADIKFNKLKLPGSNDTFVVSLPSNAQESINSLSTNSLSTNSLSVGSSMTLDGNLEGTGKILPHLEIDLYSAGYSLDDVIAQVYAPQCCASIFGRMITATGSTPNSTIENQIVAFVNSQPPSKLMNTGFVVDITTGSKNGLVLNFEAVKELNSDRDCLFKCRTSYDVDIDISEFPAYLKSGIKSLVRHVEVEFEVSAVSNILIWRPLVQRMDMVFTSSSGQESIDEGSMIPSSVGWYRYNSSDNHLAGKLSWFFNYFLRNTFILPSDYMPDSSDWYNLSVQPECNIQWTGYGPYQRYFFKFVCAWSVGTGYNQHNWTGTFQYIKSLNQDPTSNSAPYVFLYYTDWYYNIFAVRACRP